MVKESLRQNYSAMVKHSTTGFPFSVRVLYFDELEMYKTVKINTTQAVNITVRPHTLRPNLHPPSWWQFLGRSASNQLGFLLVYVIFEIFVYLFTVSPISTFKSAKYI